MDDGPEMPRGWRFQAPPGWPVTSDWQPPPGWQPDPSWPEPPPGWQFWVPASQPNRRRRLSTAAKVFVAAVGVVTALVGTYFAVKDRNPHTRDDWIQLAESACDEQFGNIRASLAPILLATGELTRTYQTTGVLDPIRLRNMVEDLSELSAAFGALAGKLRAIEVPPGVDRSERTRLLDSTAKLSAAFGTISATFAKFAVPPVVEADLQTIQDSLQTVIATLPGWAESATVLGLSQCLLIVGSPAPMPEPTFVPPTDDDLAARTLAARLNPSVLNNCEINQSMAEPTVLAALTCAAVTPGLSRPVLVMQFGNEAGLAAMIARIQVDPASPGCAAGGFRGPWEYQQVTVGTLACYQLSSEFDVLWTFDKQKIAVVAAAADGPTAFAWWTANAYLINP